MSHITIEASLKVKEGLMKDPFSDNYRVLSGYSHQALRYSFTETWLDEDDNLWILGSAVEREAGKESGTHATSPAAPASPASPSTPPQV